MDNSEKKLKLQVFLDELDTLKPMDDQKFDILKTNVRHFIGAQFGEDSFFYREIQNVEIASYVTFTIDQDTWKKGTSCLKSLLLSMLESLPEKQISRELRNDIFIVHGHDNEMKESVARLIERQGLNAIILHEKPDEGLTIIEKLDKYIQKCSFGIVLLSPEDEGATIGAKEDEYKKRARQNIILEAGWCIGKLGREKVCLLYKKSPDFELPSDIDGVLYKNYNQEDWKYELIREMSIAGLPVNSDKIKG